MRILLTFTAVALIFAFSGTAATVVPVGEFQSVELSNGGHVTVRYGAVQRVSLVRGDLKYTTVRLGSGQRLIIDTHERGPEGYRTEVEVVTPHLSRASVANGGILRTLGAFPAQDSIEAAVEQGGTVDIRSIPVDRVQASVDSGGRIFTTSRKSLTATVRSGGGITYWGNPTVSKSIRDGGVVTRGPAEDADSGGSSE